MLFVLWSESSAASSYISNGDAEFMAMNYPAALKFYNSAMEINPDDPELLWRMARIHIMIGDQYDGAAADRYYVIAETNARRCVSVVPDDARGHAWLAASLGCRALVVDTRTKLKLSHAIKQECETAIRLNPKDDVAYTILGSFYHALGNLSFVEKQLANLLLGGVPDGGFQESETALKKAIALSPGTFRHYYELGDLYKDWGRTDDTKRVWKQASTLKLQMVQDRQRLATINEWLSHN